MLIENPEAFKAWLTSVLEPLCDADPEALAKYVYALVRKDKTIDALREVMVEQLDVFLQKETKPFVELLFKTLEKQEYIHQSPVSNLIPNTNPPNPNIPITPLTPTRIPPIDFEIPPPIIKDPKPVIPVSSLPDLDPLNGSTTTPSAAICTIPPPAAAPPATAATLIKVKEINPEISKKDHKSGPGPGDVRSGGRIRHRSTSRNRSRSRSWERTIRRSRSRDNRSREREQRRDRSRPWRNKSPPRRYGGDRRRSPRSNSPQVQRLRSPRHNYRGRYRNRSPPRSHSRSRSRSPGTTGGNSSSSNGSTGNGPTTTTPSNTGPFQTKRRCRDFDEKGYCMRGDLCPYDHGVDPVVLEDTTLGNVLTFAGPNGQGQVPTSVQPSSGGMLPPGGAVPMIRAPHHHHHVMPPHHHHQRPMHPGVVMQAEYNPSAPSMWNPRSSFRGGIRPGMFHGPSGGGGGAGGGLGLGVGHVQRELISVPVMDQNVHKQQVVGSDGCMYPRTGDFISLQDNNQPGMKKNQKGFDFNRLGPRTKNNPANSLELKKVPRGLNNITHLNNHFSKFGKIVNIQVNYCGDPEAALITFFSHAEANAAYRSTEAVLNNRFIKVFWHQNDQKQENTPPPAPAQQQRSSSVKDRLGSQTTNSKVLNLVQPNADDKSNNNAEGPVNGPPFKRWTPPPATTKAENIADTKAQANAAIKKGQEILMAKEQLKKKQEEKRKEAVKLTHDLLKRKQDLLDKQLKQQHVLIDKLSKVKESQREDIKEAIRKLQESIEEIRKSLVAAVKQRTLQSAAAKHVVQTRKTKDEVQKQLLDAELDLMMKQQEGTVDTVELQKKVFELKKQAQILGCVPIGVQRRAGGGGGGNVMIPVRIQRGYKFIRGGGGVAGVKASHRLPFGNASVDHRPTKLLVSGYEIEEKNEVLSHFTQYGEISDYVSDDSTPSVVLNYKTRKEAELAMLKGRHFQDRTLSVTWCTNVQLSNQLSQRRDSRSMLLSESDEDHLLDSIADDELNTEGVDLSEEALLQDDEEEEEENEEDRSWRR